MKRFILVLLSLGILAVPVLAGDRGPFGFVPIVNSVVQDTNRWEIWQNNIAEFVSPLPSQQCGAYWPKYTGRNYIFGAGLWVGALDTTVHDTVCVRTGDLASGGSLWGPALPNGDTTGGLTDSLARIYRSDISRDTAQWPERDSIGRAIITSDQELWAISSGLDPLYPDPAYPPVGVISIRRSLAWKTPGPWGDVVKMEFEVKNVTGRYQPPARTLRKMIVGWGIDADIGNESLTNANDLCFVSPSGGSSYPNLAVQYQLPQEPGWGPPGPPYYEGFKLVSSPVNNTNDTIRVRSQPGIGYPEYNHDILPGQVIGLTSFQLFTLDIDPARPGMCYLELSGRYYQAPDSINSYAKDFYGPSDKRFLMACGPFDLPNDSTARFVLEIIAGTDSADLMYKAGLVGVESHPQPELRNNSEVILYDPAPNPTSGSSLIRYFLPDPTRVSFKIYDLTGRAVRELDRGEKAAGSHILSWDGRDGSGHTLPGGVYFFRLETPGSVQTRRLVVIR